MGGVLGARPKKSKPEESQRATTAEPSDQQEGRQVPRASTRAGARHHRMAEQKEGAREGED
jgi:hypothetical protein